MGLFETVRDIEVEHYAYAKRSKTGRFFDRPDIVTITPNVYAGRFFIVMMSGNTWRVARCGDRGKIELMELYYLHSEIDAIDSIKYITEKGPYTTLADIRSVVPMWFVSADKFGTTLETTEEIYAGRFFLDSGCVINERRHYAVRMVKEYGDDAYILTCGKWLWSWVEARRAVNKLVKDIEESE